MPTRSVYLKAMERKRWAFPLVGVAAAADRRATRVALAGVAPDPVAPGRAAWTRRRRCPRNAYKVDVAKALVRRADAALSDRLDCALRWGGRLSGGSALLGIVGSVAVGWVVGAAGHLGTTPVASAASSPRVGVDVSGQRERQRGADGACPFPSSLRSAFEAASRDAPMPPAMLYAVAKVESNLRQDAESAAGARGLLQLMPATAQSLALNIDEPASNVLAGARYLRQLIDRFGSSDLALAAYNAGPTAVALAGEAPSIDVERYVANVNALWHSVAGCR